MGQKIHIAHLVNPVRSPQDPGLAHTQALTFESMRAAAAQAEHVARVDLFTAQYPEDHEIIPAYFSRTPDLDRSVADVHTFSVHRRLPLLADLLERLQAATTARYLVYTNVDIILHPSFYEVVAARLGAGLDALIINRRRIASH